MPPVCSKRIHGRIYFIWFSNVFSQNLLINCVSLFLMLFSMFRSEPLAIACSDKIGCFHPSLPHMMWFRLWPVPLSLSNWCVWDCVTLMGLLVTAIWLYYAMLSLSSSIIIDSGNTKCSWYFFEAYVSCFLFKPLS